MQAIVGRIKYFGLLIALILIVNSLGFGLITSAASSIESDFFIVLNTERNSRGKIPLIINSSLTSAAYLHSKDMAEKNYFSHTSLDGRTFVDRIVAAGYTNYYSLGENLAYHSGSPNAATVFDMWKNSSGHYANMVGDFNEAGLGVYSLNGLTYYTLDLGKGSSPVPPPAANFSLSVSPATQAAVAGSSINYNLTIIPSNGFSGPVTFTFSGMPSGVTGSCNPNPTVSTTTLTLTVPSGVTPGTYTFSIAGTGGGLTRSTTATLIVNAAAATPAKLAFSVSPSGAKAGQVFTIQPVVLVQDVGGNIVNSSTTPVTLFITGGIGTNGAILSGPNTVNAVNGVASFNGLSINQSGSNYTLSATSGTLTSAVSSPFDVTASALSDLNITTPPNMPNGWAGIPYSTSLAASGGAPPYFWSVQTGVMPIGLSLNSSSGIISGTPTSPTSSITFTVKVTDSIGNTTNKAFSMAISSGPVIVTSSLQGGSANIAYSQSLTAAGGAPPYIWSIVNGVLPSGLSLNTLTGTISGIPTAAGTNSVIFRVSDRYGRSSTKMLSISVVSGLIITSPSTLTVGEVGVSYSQTLTASGGPLPYIWSIQSGQLPAGLSLNSVSGLLSGIPAVSGPVTITVSVKDNAGRTASKQISFTIIPRLAIITISPLPDGRVNSPYSQTLDVSGGQSPFQWTLQSGTLPAGLTLDSSKGIITGTPGVSTGSPNAVNIQVTDAIGGFAVKGFSITVLPDSLTINTASLPGGKINAIYLQPLSVSGGIFPYTWSIQSGILPTGLSLDSVTGIISGTPVVAGTFPLVFKVMDGSGSNSIKDLTLNIQSAVADLSIVTPSALPEGRAAVPYSTTLIASGGILPYAWSVQSGIMPIGLSLNPSNGTITGTPTSATSAITFSIRVTDSVGNYVSKVFSMSILSGPVISTTEMKPGVLNVAYTQYLTAIGGTSPYSWRIQSGALPVGLTLNSLTGVIAGIPKTTGMYTLVFKVTDRNYRTTTKTISLTVNSIP